MPHTRSPHLGRVAAALALGLLCTLGPGALGAARSLETSPQITPGSTRIAGSVNARDDLLQSRGQMMRTIKDLVGMAPRATGTKGGKRAARYVARRFRAAGLDKVWIEKNVSYSWRAKGHGLSVAGTALDVHPIGFSMIDGPTATGTRTLGARGLTAPVVDLTKDPNADVRGKIAVVDLKFQMPLAAMVPFMEFVHDPDRETLDAQTMLTKNPYITSLSSSIKSLQAKGAVGMIGVLADYFDSNKYYNEYYRRTPMTIPGMWITKREAVRLRTLLARTPRATMRLTTVRKKVVARTPMGILNGRSPDTVQVQSHHDSLGPGAVEDASGVAEVVALADYYGALARTGQRRSKTLMFTTFDTHFTGYQAHMGFVDKYVKNPRSPYRIVANTTIEHIAKKAVVKNGELVFTKQTEPRGFFENVSLPLKAELARIILARDLRGTTILNGTLFQPLTLPTDASFVQSAGVPTVSLIAGPVYLYDEIDDLRAIDRPELRPMLLAQRDLIDAFEATRSSGIGFLPPLPGLL